MIFSLKFCYLLLVIMDIITKTSNTIRSLITHKVVLPPSLHNKVLDFLNGRTVDGYTIFKIWNYDTTKLDNDLTYINLLFPIDVDEKTSEYILKNQKMIDNIKYSFYFMLNYYGWEYINDTVYRSLIKEKKKVLPDRPMEWFDTRVLDSLGSVSNYARIDRIFKCLLLFGLHKEAEIFFLALAKTYVKYGDKIGEKQFRQWLQTQSFWIPQDKINNYKINLTPQWDLRWRLTDLAITKGDDQQLSTFLEQFKIDFEINDDNFIDKVKELDPDERIKYLYSSAYKMDELSV